MNTTKITEDDAKKILAATQALAGVITTTLQALGSMFAAHEPAFRAIVDFVRETQADAVADERQRCHSIANDAHQLRGGVVMSAPEITIDITSPEGATESAIALAAVLNAMKPMIERIVAEAAKQAVHIERDACLGILAAAIPSHDDARRDLDRRAQREQDSGCRLGAEMTSIAASKHSGAASALHEAIKSIRARGEAPR